jgi:hypothetical protein
MTKDEIAQLMNETSGQSFGTEAHFQRFAALVAAAEREECAMALLEAAKLFVKRVDDCVPTIFFFEYQKEYNNLCAAIAEREACAELCDKLAKVQGRPGEIEHWQQGYHDGARSCVKKIRARGEE